MPEKRLLLSSARLGVLVEPAVPVWWQMAAFGVGLLVVLIGAADVTARLAHQVFDGQSGVIAFAPSVVATLSPESSASPFFASFSGATTTTSATAPALTPARLVVGAIGVDAAVESVGKKPDGTMDTPKNLSDVAWYSLGAKPGQAGSAVFAGHVNNALGADGVFAKLSTISIGDSVVVANINGQILTYIVRSIDLYPVDTAPIEEIFSTDGPSQVVLITCEGVWDPEAHSYNKRLVVTARLSAE